MSFLISAARTVALMSLVVVAIAAPAAARSWSKEENIKTSAERLAVMQLNKGATATYEFIFNCYKTHRLASQFSEPLEGCIVQDYLHSKVTAAVYDRVDEETRKKLGAPSPEHLMRLMSARVVDTYRQYGVGDEEIKAFMKQVDEQGIPAFLAKRFPKRDDDPAAEDNGKPAVPPSGN